MNSVEELQDRLNLVLKGLEPAQMRRLNTTIGKELRNSQKKRISAQQNPDGSKYTPRRPRQRDKKGRIKRTMFNKIKNAQYLRILSDQNSIAVGFIGRIARIAAVHQYGLSDRATQSAPQTIYPKRELLGCTKDDIQLIDDSVTTYLQQRLNKS